MYCEIIKLVNKGGVNLNEIISTSSYQDSLPYCIFSLLPLAEQTNITFRSGFQGSGSGFFMLVVWFELARSCPTCRTASRNLPTLLCVSVSRLPGCLSGCNGLQGPPGRNRRATSSCMSCLVIQCILYSQMHCGGEPESAL